MRHQLAACLGALVAGLAGGGDAASPEAGPFNGVKEVYLERLSGELEIRIASAAEGATLRLDGPDALVAAVEVEAGDGSLRVVGPPQSATGSTVTMAQVAIAVGRGAHSSQVVISGQPVALEPLHVAVALPPGVAIRIEGFVGEAVVGDTRAPIELELLRAYPGRPAFSQAMSAQAS